ncbi:MAG: hypothetical protein HY223_08350 [Thaumarchaeota archaeon]|nr:hypothetical protein [Nitrososphaerota archaeon]
MSENKKATEQKTANDKKICVHLTPVTVVEFAWAISAKFSKNDSTQKQGDSAEQDYDKLLKKFQEEIEGKSFGEKNSLYCEYYGELVAAMHTALKNLETCLRHRDDNFSQDEDMRKQQIEGIDSLKTFGLSFETALPKLASSTAIGGVSGLTLTNFLNGFNLPAHWHDAILFSLIGIGYLVTEFVVLPLVIWKKKKIIDSINWKKREHYQLYFKRCERELCDLFVTLKIPYEKIDPNYDPKIGNQKWDVDQVIPENEEYLVKYSGHGCKENDKKQSETQ